MSSCGVVPDSLVPSHAAAPATDFATVTGAAAVTFVPGDAITAAATQS